LTFYTTFTAATSSVDYSDDPNAFYTLDGNSTNGRLNISVGSVVTFAANTTVMIKGNPGHSYVFGRILPGENFLYGIECSNGGRGDFGHSVSTIGSSAAPAKNMIYFYGNTDGTNCNVYNHQENSFNIFSGTTEFRFSMKGGTGYIQFSSLERASVFINITSSQSGTIAVYPARSSFGFTSLTGFKVQGGSNTSGITFRKGTQTNSHGRIYDPIYVDTPNNVIPINVDSSGLISRIHEYFTLDVTTVDPGARIQVLSGTTEQFNKLATDVNCTIYASNGTTPLTYYTGKKVIPCLVRLVGTSATINRNLITYKIRIAGFEAIEEYDLAMNGPVVIEGMQIDHGYSHTATTITEIATADQLYDAITDLMCADMDIPEDLFIHTGTTLEILDTWRLKRDQTLTAPVVIDKTAKEIKVKTASIVALTSKFIKLEGTIDASFDGFTTLGYVKANGKVNINIVGIDPESFGHGLSAVFFKKRTETLYVKVASPNNNVLIELDPSILYDFKVYSAGYEDTAFSLTSQGQGFTHSITVRAVKDLNGVLLYTHSSINATQEALITYSAGKALLTFTGTSQTQIDFHTLYKALERVTHQPDVIGMFNHPAHVSADRTGFVIPLGNYLQMITSASTVSSIILQCPIRRPDGTSAQEGAIQKLDGSDYEISGVKQYHFSPKISTAYDVRVVTVSVPASTLQTVTDQIPTKVTEALTTYTAPTKAQMEAIIIDKGAEVLTTYTAPTTTEMIALILTHVQAAMTTYTAPTTAETIALILEHVQAAMTTYTSPKTSEMITLILTHVQAALTTYTSPTTVEMQAIVTEKVLAALVTHTSPTTAEIIALILEHVQAAMTTYTVPKTAEIMRAIISGVVGLV
jgi:hypothetical protein